MTKPDFVHHFMEGIDHFNSRRFWEAHEAWEALWLVAESEAEQFLQGLIQVAAAYHHVQRGTYRGAARLFAAGLRRLEPFPPLYCGLDRSRVEEAARRHQAWLERAKTAPQEPLGESEYPQLVAQGAGNIAPPSLQW